MDIEQKAPPSNPLLANVRIPGETFRLPSQGLFYINGELDDTVVNGEVEVYPMTAMEEVILSTPDKLLSGKAVVEIFSNCIPQIKQPGALLSKDVDFLMVCLRMVTFGQYMEIAYQHDCENAKQNSYMVDLQKMIRETRAIDATRLKDEYSLTLPNGQRVSLKPLIYDDMVALFQNTAMSKTDGSSDEENKRVFIETLARVIHDVDGETNKDFIEEWVTKISWGWKRDIERAAQSVSQWGTEFISTQVCKDCGSDLKIFVSANPVNFFM